MGCAPIHVRRAGIEPSGSSTTSKRPLTASTRLLLIKLPRSRGRPSAAAIAVDRRPGRASHGLDCLARSPLSSCSFRGGTWISRRAILNRDVQLPAENEEFRRARLLLRVLPGRDFLPSIVSCYLSLAEKLTARRRINNVTTFSATISKAALHKKSLICEKALDVFVESNGAMAGKPVAFGDAPWPAAVGGGIAPKIIEKLKDGTFMRNFAAKGRFNALLMGMPVHVILDDKTALYGAARQALQAGA